MSIQVLSFSISQETKSSSLMSFLQVILSLVAVAISFSFGYALVGFYRI
jgi:hypothetical protein